MIVFLKDLGLLLIWLFTATLASIGFSPGAVVAPDLEPPVRILIENPYENRREIEPVKETATAENDGHEKQNGSETPQEATAGADPFKELADAFAKLAEEKTIPPLDTPSFAGNANDLVRSALVNIICVTETSGPFNSISASGVIIDSRGVILTNAHVAQYFLLENYPKPGFVECTIRTGSPATAKYTAELLYLPPSWITQNAQKIDDENPTGNGEHDYALVRITGTVSKNITMPNSFPALPVSLGTPDTGDSVLVAGYPAGFLGGITIAKELYAVSAQAKVGQLFTFGSQSIDLYSIGGTVVAQQGSSGGAVANQKGTLVGLVVTATDAPDTASRDLRALTTEYIVNDFKKETGVSLPDFLSPNLTERALSFRLVTMPSLTKALTDVLEK